MTMRIREQTSAWAREQAGHVTDRDSPGLCRAGVEIGGHLEYVCLLPDGHDPGHRWMTNRGREVAINDEDDEVHRLRAQVQAYENAITWDTTCLSCSATMNALAGETERAEKAEALLRDARTHLAATHCHAGQHDHLGEGLGCAGCELLNRIEEAGLR